MANLIYCEFLKLKRSKMIIISILGAMVTPLMIFVDIIKLRMNNSGKIITYYYVFEDVNMYVMLLFGIIVYTLIGSYLFSREYTESTLKTILTVPVSKTAFIAAKFLMLLIWILGLTAVAWVCTLFFAVIGKVTDFSMTIIIKSIYEYFFGAILVYLVILPFIFIAIKMKNLVTPIIVVTAAAMGSAAVINEPEAGLYPWAATNLLVTGTLVKKTGHTIWPAVIMIAILAAAGFIASLIYFNKHDVK